METTFKLEGLPELAARLDSIATVVSGPIARHGLEAGGEVIAEQARANVHKLTGMLADDVVVVVRVHQEAGESYALIGPGWDPEAFRSTQQRRGRWANEAPAPDETTNPGLYGKFLETGHREPGQGLAHNLDYQRARRQAKKNGTRYRHVRVRNTHDSALSLARASARCAWRRGAGSLRRHHARRSRRIGNMSLFGKIVRTAINTALLPVAVVKDVVTLGNIASADKTYTQQQLEQIKEEAEDSE